MMFEYSFDNIQKIAIVSLFFVIGGILGWCLETCFYRVNDGRFIRRGHGIGPWLPIYAFGGLSILLLTYKFSENPLMIVLISAIVAGIVEYGTGWFLYHHFDGLRLWDYNIEKWNWGNVQGFICFRSISFFAIAGLFIDFVLFPSVCNLALSVSHFAFCSISFTLLLLFVTDIFIGYFVKGFEKIMNRHKYFLER